ncbi:non-functional NADPH-dependent codeinone reductase 2-like [Durio zibethinus]|uniref:Non-functional NADPH-dependent codeinone reductase 2-like n=1 Tax=Durio zibethinus TaxID=66656 RepID=A0A6P6BFF4_DURZI|nr:non-functional NADPH-dependent codeinone reductase 2-like [Durio zibethinus]
MACSLFMGATSFSIPEHVLAHCGKRMPLLGLGTVASPPVGSEATKMAILQAIKPGYRHFDTAAKYGSGPPLGEAIKRTFDWTNSISRRVLHHDQAMVRRCSWRTCCPCTQEKLTIARGLASQSLLGVSNFSCKKLTDILAIAKIPPAVNQKKLREFSQAKGILLTAYSPLGANGTSWGSNRVLERGALKEIAEAKGITVAQVLFPPTNVVLFSFFPLLFSRLGLTFGNLNKSRHIESLVNHSKNRRP